ncbi:MAG: hypothetical protein AB7S68_02335 [Polyangiaceae bacterium]
MSDLNHDTSSSSGDVNQAESNSGEDASITALGDATGGVSAYRATGSSATAADVPVGPAAEPVELGVLPLTVVADEDRESTSLGAAHGAAEGAPSPPNSRESKAATKSLAAEEAHRALASLVLPQVCACCGAVSSASRRLDLDAQIGALIVPLCERCLTHDAVARTRSLSVVLAASLVGGATALGLPLVFERLASRGTWQLSVDSWLSRWGFFLLPCGIVLALFGLRSLGWYVWARLRRTPNCSPAPVVAIRETGRSPGEAETVAVVRCTRPDFAHQVLALNPRRVIALSRTSERWSALPPLMGGRWMYGVLLLTALLSIASYVVHRPRIQVLNLTEQPISLEVDGEVIARVPVTSQESPEAGVALRLPAGRRHFRTLIDAGLPSERVIAEADLTLQGAVRHLYVPAADGYCFWLERIAYGRGNADEPSPGAVERLPLGNPLGFWAFPQAPDVWLAPPPEPLLDDARSSGGEVTALRQARCIDAPKDARH